MKPQPINTPAAARPGRSRDRNGRDAPTIMVPDPTIIGPREPTRSVNRPALIEKNIGRAAYSAISTPTVSGEDFRWIAYSATATRLPAYSEWLRMFRIMRR